MGSRARPLNKMPMKTYQVIGRSAPTDAVPEPKLYKMKLFAPNEVVAKSRYWYFLSQIVKAKKATGTIKNYGIFLRYDSRSGTHNMYKEFRDVSLNGAINQLYTDMAGRHRARKRSVYVIKAEQVRPKECKLTSTKAFHKDDLKFPLPHRAQQRTHKRYKNLYAVSRPTTHQG